MNSVARRLSSLFRHSGFTIEPFNNGHHQMQQLQQCRGIRVRVLNGNLEAALGLMQRKMQSSGIERMIKQEQRFHIKNSEKRVLARKNLERRLRSEDLAKKLKIIMIKKVRSGHSKTVDNGPQIGGSNNILRLRTTTRTIICSAAVPA
ncbi:hypothetical protein VNO78_15133 [Psophocarpus tetragonolobus]|uniref:Ribosomal protein S21 n=1 Tax=Psophocarpus tetragonolobus TaxID=3891 RepID=A0AAN9XJK8_PSOTE